MLKNDIEKILLKEGVFDKLFGKKKEEVPETNIQIKVGNDLDNLVEKYKSQFAELVQNFSNDFGSIEQNLENISKESKIQVNRIKQSFVENIVAANKKLQHFQKIAEMMKTGEDFEEQEKVKGNFQAKEKDFASRNEEWDNLMGPMDSEQRFDSSSIYAKLLKMLPISKKSIMSSSKALELARIVNNMLKNNSYEDLMRLKQPEFLNVARESGLNNG